MPNPLLKTTADLYTNGTLEPAILVDIGKLWSTTLPCIGFFYVSSIQSVPYQMFYSITIAETWSKGHSSSQPKLLHSNIGYQQVLIAR